MNHINSHFKELLPSDIEIGQGTFYFWRKSEGTNDKTMESYVFGLEINGQFVDTKDLCEIFKNFSSN